MPKKTIIALHILLCAICSTSLAQSSPTLYHQSNYYAISIKNILFFSNGFNYSTRVTEQIGVQATLSLLFATGAEVGVDYFFLKNEKEFNPYTGLHAAWMTMKLLTRSDYLGIMVPIGVEIYKGLWLFGFETGYMFLRESSYRQGDFSPNRYENHHLPYFAGKVGFRLPRKK